MTDPYYLTKEGYAKPKEFLGASDEEISSTLEWRNKDNNDRKNETTGLLDNTYRTSTQESIHNDYRNETPEYKKSPLLDKPIPVKDVNPKLIRKPIECAKYAVWHKTEHYYIPLPCKKWSCHHCIEKNAKELERRLANSEASKWSIISHVTLSVAEDAITSNLSDLLNDFITDLRRNGFPRLKYLWVKEFQYERYLKSGIWYRHIHMVVNCAITKYDIIPYWNKANKNKFNMVEVRPVRSFKKGSYLTKYFTKEEHQSIFAKGERRYGSSKGVLPSKPLKEPSDDWEFMLLAEAQNLLDAYESDPELEITWSPKKCNKCTS